MTRITIHFGTLPPSITELMAIRKTLPSFRDMPPAKVREIVGQSQEFLVDILPTDAAKRLIETLKDSGLDVMAKSEFIVSYLPYNRTTKRAWHIKSGEEAAAVARAMIAEGVPIGDGIPVFDSP